MDSLTSSRVCIVEHGHADDNIELQDNCSDGSRTPGWREASREQPTSNVVYREDVPPDGGYGWVCTACVFLINANAWGTNSAWGVFLNYYLHNSTFPGSTQLQFALIGGLSISQSLIIAPLISYTKTRLGLRLTLCMGTVILSSALLAASFSTQVWHLFLSIGLLFGYGIGLLYIPATAMLPPWFSSRRSLANGIASSGAGLGGLVYNLATERAIANLGVENAFRVLAATSFIANLVSSLLVKERPSRTPTQTQRIFNYRSLGQLEVLLVVIWGAATELGFVALFFSMPAYATSIGLSAKQGSIAGALLNLGLGIGRPVVGLMSDSFGRINVAMVMTLFCAALCLSLWIAASSFGVLIAFALLVGTACGTFWCTVAPVLADIVGIADLAPVFAIICFALVPSATFAEPVALHIASTANGVHSYLHTQAYVGCMFLIGGLSLVILRSWKIYDNQKASKDEPLVNGPSRERPGAWQDWKKYLKTLSKNVVQPRKV